MSIKKALFNVLSGHLEPKILHQTNGRVRIHLPVLKRIPGEFHYEAEELLAMASFNPAIDDASVSFVSGNILIHFDSQQVSARDILKVFIFLNQLFLRNREQLLSNPGVQLSELKQKLPDFLARINLKTFNAKEFENHAF